MATPTSLSPQTRPSKFSNVLLWIGFILIALNLRLIFATVGPLLQNLELSFRSTLLVTTLPLFLLGGCCYLGIVFRQKLGEEKSLFWALILLSLGCAVRYFGETGLILGTILGSTGIAVMNVIMPALAKKRFPPQSIGLVMGIYALMLGVGAVLGASMSFPLFQVFGSDRDAAFITLACAALPAFVALIFWLPQLSQRRVPDSSPTAPPAAHPAAQSSTKSVYSNWMAWSITLFFGLQTLNLYVFLPWLPTLLMAQQIDQAQASFIFSLSQLSLMLASFSIPLWAARYRDHRGLIVLIIILSLMGTLGVQFGAVAHKVFWACCLGFAQGAAPALCVYLFIAKSGNIETAVKLAVMAQMLGYFMAAIGPLWIAYFYQRGIDWNQQILLLSAILVAELFLCWQAGKNVKIQ
ncbi:hypothetical protein BFG52_10765 [Acinetobacter larvae]|uniref:MFS transporter n=1 Tax=Acinetobacter larvae TaxID=1789224 RepID=A0A1B2M488_9GAMM|nr:hypothetical protein BFG52_10765 [Acinetobacter larvae]